MDVPIETGCAMRTVIETAPIHLRMRERRLRWNGHILRRPRNHPVRLPLDFDAPRKHSRGVSKKRWKDVIKRDLSGATADDSLDRMGRRITSTADPATA